MPKNKRFKLSSACLLGLAAVAAQAGYAASPLQMSHQSVATLKAMATPASLAQHSTVIHETSRHLDANKTLHVRVAQTYKGYPVIGSEAIVHIPNAGKIAPTLTGALAATNAKTFMNGRLYQGLNTDLANASPVIFTEANASKALTHAVKNYSRKVGVDVVAGQQSSKLVVFMDDAHKAHWAYQVSFDVAPLKEGKLPAKPNFIMDANTFKVLAQWDNIKTLDHGDDNNAEAVMGGGFGGNLKMGKLSYDGMGDDYAALRMVRNADTNTCYLHNSDVVVKEYYSRKVVSFDCKAKNADHANLYWDEDLHTVNDGYSPDNDALFGGDVIKEMYRDWYHTPVLMKNGKPMLLEMVVHARMDNAYWDGSRMTFGDGINMFYPLTSLGVAAHEISHGFTQQHSNLQYWGQSGGMNEAFSDMAAQAAELYAYGKNSWMIGPEIFKRENEALRYLDKPSKDCHGKKPGNWCSIDNVDEYYSGLDVHYSSGIYNRTYYLMGSAQGWDARKAFDVMVKANEDYWTANTTWAEGACGVLQAAADLKYDDSVVRKAFDTVGVDMSECMTKFPEPVSKKA